MRLITSFFILAFLATSAGCGYTSKSLLPAELDSIHVDNFVNKVDPTMEVSDKRASYTYWPGLETSITKGVIDEFIYDRNLTVKSKKDAALLLKGELVDYRELPLSYDDDDNVEEFRVEIFVDIELYNNLTGELMWKENHFMGQSTYTVTGPHAQTSSEAVTAAVKDLAPRIVERTVDVW